jgi:hypothetical protein
MNIASSTLAGAFAALGLAAALPANANVVAPAGYYDLAPCCGNPNALPSPWHGSPNTSFFGSASVATSSDPDESATLLVNAGTTPVTQDSGFEIGSIEAWNGFIGSGFGLAPGKGVILSGTATQDLDGSDMGLTDQTITFDLNGKAYAFQDRSSVLAGYPANDEVLPRTQIGTVSFTTSVPEPGSWALMLLGLGFLGAVLRGHVVAGRRLAALEVEPT